MNVMRQAIEDCSCKVLSPQIVASIERPKTSGFVAVKGGYLASRNIEMIILDYGGGFIGRARSA